MILLIIGIILYYLLKVQHIDISVVLLMLLTFSTIFYVRIYKQRPYHYSNIVLMVFVFSMYSIYVIYQVTEKKSLREKKDLATSLAYEHDQIAEYLIGDIGESIESDTTLRMLLLRHKIDYPWLYKYIKKKYFTGYWDKYELQATICRPVDSVLIEPKLLHEHCFDFFSNLMSQNTQEISGTSFYFLKNSNGRISYISAFSFSDKKSKESVNLYLQLDLKMAVEELGYPELLLDEKLTRENRKPEYSFAKYYKNNLLSQSGTFLYSLNARKYTLSDKKYSFFRFGGYDHFFYRPDKENLLIISKPEIKVFDLLIIFSYLFIFFFLVLNLMLLVIEPKKVRFSTYKDFKSKIRLSIIGVLIFSLIGVGSISIYFVVKQYKNKNYETIDEKLQSVYMELESKLGQENTIDFNWNSFEYSNLEELLRKLSNVFYTDINLYDANGRMIASSRPEIFEKGLSGNYMNPEAYFQIAKNNKPEFTIEETIGTFQYSSVYSPFTNDNDKLMAYLNLPYFTRQSALKQEISSLLLTIINFYVLLIMLSVSFAVFVSEQITKPLRYIRERFATIKLGAGVEKILYKNHDEIGDLVEEYNRMVDELERSLGLLAKSERESAWREMAKQIAHEIKNPLTPMKLSIQQLQRAWNDKNENLDVYFSRVTRTLIEQIDNLSKIATEFSDFAKIPKPSFEKINLELLLPGIIDLFAQSGSKFVLQYNKKQQFTVMVDKEQISRVFINLATNAVQAIPEGRHGIIEIILTRTDKEILVTFHDNGSGIPEEMADKLFQPSFTTKSGGMGLGLAISKNIIENSGGQITCNSIQGVGTTFVISLPIS